MRFKVRALTEANRFVELEFEADGPQEAKAELKARGWSAVSVEPVASPRRRWILSRPPEFSLLLFSQQLVSLLDAGLTAVEALEVLAESEARQHGAAVVSQLLAEIRQGASISSAMEGLPAVFPSYFVATVRASEQTGGVAEALGRWAAYQEKIDAAKRQLRQSLIYPGVLIVAGLAVSLFLLLYVVPRFSTIYEGRLEDLPWLSMLLIQWGQMAAPHAGFLSLLALLLLVGTVAMLRRPDFMARVWQVAWAMPYLGEKLRLYQLARLYRTLGMLLRGGMPVVSALEYMPGLVVTALRTPVTDALNLIRDGRSILVAFQQAGLTTPVSDRMLRVGQRSGNMDGMMERIASYYDDETQRAMNTFLKTFEPAVMAVIGLLVGGIVILMYIPIFEIAGRLQS